jgi:hypothetical protein
MKTWFEKLTGIPEKSASYVREQLVVADGMLMSRANGQSWKHGTLEIPSLEELQSRVAALPQPTQKGQLRLRSIVANVRDLHTAPENANALFQVASQFNLLEMVGPSVTPEAGIGGYENDRTQGPICAIAAGAGTIYRQYFVDIDGKQGQTDRRQVDCLSDFGKRFAEISGEPDRAFWTMSNGYALPDSEQIECINKVLERATEEERNRLRQSLRVGVQWQTQVTMGDSHHCVSQIYCSALPVGYCNFRDKAKEFELFAPLVLEASYEATLAAAVLNANRDRKEGSQTVYLTLIGGGVFQNEISWICHAIDRALSRYQDWDLDVVIVSYSRNMDGHVSALLDRWSPVADCCWG